MIQTYAPRRLPVLAEILPRTVTSTGLVVVLATALTAVAAQISFPIPGSPVPVTGQTFAVLITAAALGPVRGLLGQVLYLAVGALGLPVFSDHTHGLQVIAGVDGGYLVGFLLAALVVGAGSRYGSDRSVPRELAVLVLASVIIYVCGATWLAIQAGLSAHAAISAGVTPFLLGDALKAVLAAGLLPAAWKLVSRIAPGSGQ
jgi:biotin transport system substrate-specific component